MGARNDSPPAVAVDARSFAWTGDARGVLTTRTAAIEAREVAKTDAGARCARVEGATAAGRAPTTVRAANIICSGAFENLEAWTRRTRARATRTRPADGRREGEAEAFREASDGRLAPRDTRALEMCAREDARCRPTPPKPLLLQESLARSSAPPTALRARSVRGEIGYADRAPIEPPPRRARPIFHP